MQAIVQLLVCWQIGFVESWNTLHTVDQCRAHDTIVAGKGSTTGVCVCVCVCVCAFDFQC